MSQEFYKCIEEWADRCREKDKAIDALQAKVRELEERLKEQKQLTEHAEASEEYARAEWTKDLARLADLEAKLRKAEERLEIDHEGEGGAWHPTRRIA